VRSVLVKLATAQESGLILVILIIGGALTVFGGTKSLKQNLEIPPEAVVEIAPEVITLTEGERTTSYRVDEGWSYDELRSGRRFLRGPEVEVNRFLETNNLVEVATYSSFIAVMAVGMTAVIILAGIDLSVGSIYALAAIVCAIVLHRLDAGTLGIVAVPLGLLICCAVGGACGFANGVMTVGFRVHPFVVTLGTMAALRGLTFIIPKEMMGTQSVSGFPESFTKGFFKGEIDVLGTTIYPVPVLIMILVGLIGMFLLSRTVTGRQVYAIGGNETAAKYAGIPVGRVKVIVFTLMGVLAGLSACMYLGYYGAAETSAGTTYELQVIAAAVIGGASLMGGRGSALGAVLGAIIIKLIDNAMLILQIDQDYNQIVMGAAIIIAVVIDQSKTRLSSRRG